MIRAMTLNDVPFYNEIRNECKDFLHDSSFYTIEESYNWFETNNPKFFIYEIDGNKIGYFRTSNWTNEGCYIGLDIHKKFRGKKLAFKAYQDFFVFLKNKIGKRSFYEFYLEVLSFNKVAINLYKKLGFTELSKTPTGKNGEPIYNIKMKLILENE